MTRVALDRRVAGLVAEYGSPDACPGALMYDRHRDEAVAFTIVEPDLSCRDLTFGELGELSARFAEGLARGRCGRDADGQVGRAAWSGRSTPTR